MAASDLTAARVRELLHYDPETGQFVWLISSSPNCKPGQVAGTTTAKGYRQIRVDGTTYLAHRLAWLHATGAWPQGHIDHINGITTDNRMVNLRDVSHSVNMQNTRRASRNSQSGVLGVSPLGKRWIAKIRVDGADVFLGSFATIEAAAEAYLSCKRQRHEGCTI
jgi:hypothetical protein